MEELGYTDDEMSALPITVVQEVDRFGGGRTGTATRRRTKLFSSIAVVILYVSEPIEVELDGVGGSKQQLKRDVLFLAVVHIPGNLTAQRYCDEILQPHVLPLMQQNGARFQHDNARPHTARITTALLTNFLFHLKLIAHVDYR
jgi:hypothetical protein